MIKNIIIILCVCGCVIDDVCCWWCIVFNVIVNVYFTVDRVGLLKDEFKPVDFMCSWFTCIFIYTSTPTKNWKTRKFYNSWTRRRRRRTRHAIRDNVTTVGGKIRGGKAVNLKEVVEKIPTSLWPGRGKLEWAQWGRQTSPGSCFHLWIFGSYASCKPSLLHTPVVLYEASCKPKFAL